MAQRVKALSAVPGTPELDPQHPQTHTVERNTNSHRLFPDLHMCAPTYTLIHNTLSK